MRVWHLIDAGSRQATATTLELLGQSLGRLPELQQVVWLMGGAALRQAAAAVAIGGAQMIGVPFGHGLSGYFALQRRARALPPPDVVHCWSIGTLSLAVLLFRGAAKVLTLTVVPTERQVRWLGVLAGDLRTPIVLVPISSTIRRTLLSRGLSEQRVHVLRPSVDMGRVDFAARRSLRRHWSIGAEQTVVVLVADPPQAGGAAAAAMAVGLADHVRGGSSTSIRLLLHPDSHDRVRAQRDTAQIGRADQLIFDAALAEPWRILPGCDVALAQGTGSGGLSLLWAMGANVPIVGEATYAISEFLEDRHSALLARPNEPRGIAHRLCRLLDEPQLAWQLRDTARHEAYSFFSRQRYCHDLLVVYRQLVGGRPIEVPPMEVTGGLRFAGRA